MQSEINRIQAAAAHPENWTVIKPRRKAVNPLLSLRASVPTPIKPALAVRQGVWA